MKTYNSTINKIRLVREKSDYQKAKIKSSQEAADYIRQFYHEDINIYESFYILLLNSAMNTTGYVKISQGGINGTVVDPILIAKYAIESLAKFIIMCHNHPTGTLRPSTQDKNITNKIKKGLELFEIRIADHIIISESNHFSFADEGIL